MDPQTLTLDPPTPRSPTPDPAGGGGGSGASSPSRGLNAAAPAFVPRSPPPPPPPRIARIHHAAAPPPPHHAFHPPPPYYAELAVELPADLDPASPVSEVDGLSEEVISKITRQVEYYFSDINLATTELLMRFISRDVDGYVPMSVIGCFKKVKSLVQNYSLLANALRTSSKLVVSDDGRKVRRQQPFTESDLEEMQSRIVVAENLPEDHSYQSLKRIFSPAGRVKTIRTCYPQPPNVATPAANKATKMDMLFGNRLHAFVEFETLDDAERAVAELNDERNWRSGLRVRSLHHCMTKHGATRGRKGTYDGDGNGNGNEEEDASTSNQPIEKHMEDPSLLSEISGDHTGEDIYNDRDGSMRRGRGRGRGARGRGRGQYYNNRGNGGHVIGQLSSHHVHNEQPVITKQPPGPRMPDGTKGFTMGRGKPLNSDTTV